MVDVKREIVISTAASIRQDISPTLREPKENMSARQEKASQGETARFSNK